jgi:methylthioribose-1-phosphate isomerase
VDPPGFESVSALIPTTGLPKPAVRSARIIPFKSSLKDAARKQKDKGDESSTSIKELHAAEQALRTARANAEDLAAAEKKAATDVSEAENKRREAERLYETARIAEQDARKRLDRAAAEAERAARAMDDAARAVERARRKAQT